MKRVLIIAGLDPSGGAGVVRDIATVSSTGCQPSCIVTSLTVQSTRRAGEVRPVEGQFLSKQFEELAFEARPDSVKIGLLGSLSVSGAVKQAIEDFEFENIVLDPVMVSASGYTFLDDDTVGFMKRELFPLATIVTPNVHEAEVLAGVKITGVEEMKKAALTIKSSGPRYVLIKGGHLGSDEIIDLLYDGEESYCFKHKRVRDTWSHGTGCFLSSAIASFMALNGGEVLKSVGEARDFLLRALEAGIPEGDAGGVGWMTVERIKLLERLKGSLAILRKHDILPLVPEVGCNIVECIEGARDHSDVVGLKGRIIKYSNGVHYNCYPQFGVSRHVATIALTANRFDSEVKSAMNLKFSEEALRASGDIGFKIGEFDRRELREVSEEVKVSTMELGTKNVIERTGSVPDIIFDRGAMGKEPMLRLLGKDSIDVVDKAIKILGGLNDTAKKG